MEIAFLYWSECPSWERALEMVREEMSQLGLPAASLHVEEMPDEAAAERNRFPGSPTVRIDGRDVEDPGAAPIGLTCRVYRRQDGRISPLPDREELAKALREAAKGAADE